MEALQAPKQWNTSYRPDCSVEPKRAFWNRNRANKHWERDRCGEEPDWVITVTFMSPSPNARGCADYCAPVLAHAASHVNDYELAGSSADGRSTALLRRDKKAMGWPCPLTLTLSITSGFWGEGQACRKLPTPSLRNTGLISCSLPLWEVRKLYYMRASMLVSLQNRFSFLPCSWVARTSLYSLSRGWRDIINTGVSVTHNFSSWINLIGQTTNSKFSPFHLSMYISSVHVTPKKKGLSL